MTYWRFGMTQRTKRQILLETLAYYTSGEHNRGLDAVGACTYLSKAGDKCAVGRCMMSPPLNTYLTASELDEHTDDGLDSLLFPEYAGHELLFWADLQMWHDDVDYWDGHDLTDEGQDAFNRLLAKWG